MTHFVFKYLQELFTALQKLALKTAASRSNQLMLFNAGSLGPF